jgi:hypothetical protein
MMSRYVLPVVMLLGGTQLAAQEIEIKGQVRKLQPKPQEPYWKESSETLRDAGTIPLPEDVDLSGLQTPIKDQANRGSCAYFTTTALFEHAFKKYFPDNHDVNLSEEYLIFANKALDQVNSREDASYLPRNIQSMKTHGLHLEESVPYSHSWFEKGMPCASYEDDRTAPEFCRSHFGPDPAVQAALIPSDLYDVRVRSLRSIREVQENLAAGFAVTISVPVNQNGWNGDGGLVTHSQELEDQCKVEPDLCGGHTVLLTGYNEKEQVFYFKNSWGTGWGVLGYGRMPFDFVKNWSYGSFYTAEVKRLDAELVNSERPFSLTPVVSMVRPATDAQGRTGVAVDLQFTYEAPVGTFFYVSLFPQVKDNPSQDPAAPASYKPVYAATEDGGETIIRDTRFVLAQKPEDLIYSAEKPLQLFIADEELEKAGVKNRPELVLRPSIYSMSDSESYKILYREYLDLTQGARKRPAHERRQGMSVGF